MMKTPMDRLKGHLRVAGFFILMFYFFWGLSLIVSWLALGHMPEEPLWWVLLYPLILVGGLGLVIGAFFLVVRIGLFFLDRFPNLFEAIKGTAGAAISAPFKFLEAKAREFEVKGDGETAEFYRKFGLVLAYLLFFGSMLLIGLILNWLGVDVGEGE